MPFDYTSVGGTPIRTLKHLVGNSGPGIQINVGYNFGWIPPAERTVQQQERHNEFLAAMIPTNHLMTLPVAKALPDKCFLWDVYRPALSIKDLLYIWQLTGSCVGAGGFNAVQTLLAMEVALGGAYEFPEKGIGWWLYAYGASRHILGDDSEGEGSFGSSYAEAIQKYGELLAEDVPELMSAFKEVNGWLQLTSRVEMDWSAWPHHGPNYQDKAKSHVGSVVRIKSSQDAMTALANGIPLTWAGSKGYKSITPQGNPKVNFGRNDTVWGHQQFCAGYWKHPDLGLIFYKGNNWGPDAHPSPLQGEPPGGFWVPEKDLVSDCNSDGEIYALSSLPGFPAQNVDWANV